jgi:hypothetical protein
MEMRLSFLKLIMKNLAHGAGYGLEHLNMQYQYTKTTFLFIRLSIVKIFSKATGQFNSLLKIERKIQLNLDSSVQNLCFCLFGCHLYTWFST